LQTAVRAFWEIFVRALPRATFLREKLIKVDDLAVVRWLYRWVDDEERPQHVQGVASLRVRGDPAP
jgi:hypothetical protein